LQMEENCISTTELLDLWSIDFLKKGIY
jgi:hypothetical protein